MRISYTKKRYFLPFKQAKNTATNKTQLKCYLNKRKTAIYSI